MMKKSLLSLGLAFALFLGTITTSTAEEVYKIGAILPLTGNLAFLGEPGKNALTMGQEELRRKGINIDIKFYDSKADPKEGISAFYKAIDIDKVKFVLTTLTGVSLAVKPIANEKKIFQGIIAIYPAITKGSNYAMRFCYNAELEAKVILNYVEQKNMRKLFIIWIFDISSLWKKQCPEIGKHLIFTEKLMGKPAQKKSPKINMLDIFLISQVLLVIYCMH